MIRPSMLPTSEKCGLAPVLAANDPRGSGSRARVGTAYHAVAASAPNANDLIEALTDSEKGELAELRWPSDIPPDAIRERKLGLSPTGRHTEPGTPGNLTEGTPDVFWTSEDEHGKMLHLADYKTGSLPVEDGPLSLQLVAYGFAAADLMGCDSMQLSIWYARGSGHWDNAEPVALDSSQAADLWKRVTAAATALPVAQPGPHCETCWQRAICPARLLPAMDGAALGELEPFTAGATTELTGPRAEERGCGSSPPCARWRTGPRSTFEPKWWPAGCASSATGRSTGPPRWPGGGPPAWRTSQRRVFCSTSSKGSPTSAGDSSGHDHLSRPRLHQSPHGPQDPLRWSSCPAAERKAIRSVDSQAPRPRG